MKSSKKPKKSVRSKRSAKELQEPNLHRSGWKRFWDRFCAM